MPNSISVKITVGKRSIEEIFDEHDLKFMNDDFEYLKSNGSHPENITFERYIRPIKLSIRELDTLNISDKNTHWCYEYVGWFCTTFTNFSNQSPKSWFGESFYDGVLEVTWK